MLRRRTRSNLTEEEKKELEIAKARRKVFLEACTNNEIENVTEFILSGQLSVRDEHRGFLNCCKSGHLKLLKIFLEISKNDPIIAKDQNKNNGFLWACKKCTIGNC